MTNIKIGMWVGIGDSGLWHSAFEEDVVAFQTKHALIADIRDACMDARKTPLVKKIGLHKYIYNIKDCDTLRFDREFIIEKVTKENISRLQEL